MSALKLISVRHGSVQKSMVFYTGMPAAELRRLLIATFSPPPHLSQLWADAPMAFADPMGGRTLALHDACQNAPALPDVVDLLVLGVGGSQAAAAPLAPSQPSSAAAAATAASSSTRPLLHHHQHRVQPYPQHHTRQPSQQQQQQQQQNYAAQQPQPQPHSPESPSSPSSPSLSSSRPPYVLQLRSASEVLQALQLSDSVIVLLYIHLHTQAILPLTRLYQQLASSGHFPQLLFLSIEHSLLASTSPSPPPSPPSLQLFYAGTSIGQVLHLTEEQMLTLAHSSQELCTQLHHTPPAPQPPPSSSPLTSRPRVQWEEGEQDEGVLLSTDEAIALESLVLREAPEVVAAYEAFPQLSLVVDAFMRIARHIGREKAKRRMGGGMGGEEGDGGGEGGVYGEVLGGALQGLREGGLISEEDAQGVRRMYEEGTGRVAEVLQRFSRDGGEEALMEGLWELAMQGKVDRQHADGAREWEGRDDSEGMRARRTGQAGKGRRSRWDTPPGQAATQQQQQAEAEAEEEDDDADDDDDELDDEGEDDDEDDEEEDGERDDVNDSVQSTPPSSSAAQSAVTSSSSSPLFTSAVSTLATLSAQGLVSPTELSLYVHLLSSSHPLIVAAFQSYGDTNDLTDLVDTLQRIRRTALTPPRPSSTTSSDLAALLSLLPSDFTSSHSASIGRLVAQRDAILLSALQLWKEQGRDAEKRGTKGNEAQSGDVQQLLAIVRKRVEKEGRHHGQTTGGKGEKAQLLKSVNEASAGEEEDSSQRAASIAAQLSSRPQSPQSPQVSAAEIDALKTAYTSGLTRSSHAQATLTAALAALVASGVISDEEKKGVETNWRDGDARLLAVLQVHEADEDDDELRDSLTRIAKRTTQPAQQPGAQAKGEEEKDDAQRDAEEDGQGAEEEQSKEAGGKEEPAVTVDDITGLASPTAAAPSAAVE